MVLRLYVDLMSQPSRAVTLFLRVNGIPYEEVLVPLRKGQHQSPAYTQVNPFQKVPAIDHDGYKITESVAILPYLCRMFSVPDHWYPKTDVRKQARIESYMAWQHLNIRAYGSPYFRHCLTAYATGTSPDESKLAKYIAGLETVLKLMDTVWLKDNPYIATEEMSIADLLAVSELEQPGIAGYDVTADHPRIADYMQLVRSNLQPHYDEVHQVAFTMRDKMKAKLKTQTKL